MSILLAAKCAPDEKILAAVDKAGIEAVEIYTSKGILSDVKGVIKVCQKFPFKYAVHAPNDDFNPDKLLDFVSGINAELINFHDIFWEDEWLKIIKVFEGSGIKLCVENIKSINDCFRFERRYGFGRCLDMEHLQFEISGVFEEEFVAVLSKSFHIHLTGYFSGSTLWHTHIHHSPKHNKKMLELIRKSGYNGMVVSEAEVKFQTYNEFRDLKKYFDRNIKHNTDF